MLTRCEFVLEKLDDDNLLSAERLERDESVLIGGLVDRMRTELPAELPDVLLLTLSVLLSLLLPGGADGTGVAIMLSS